MRINVSSVLSHIQHVSSQGPVAAGELIKAFRVDTPKQRQKLENIVTHLAGQNMIICTGSGIQARNVSRPNAA